MIKIKNVKLSKIKVLDPYFFKDIVYTDKVNLTLETIISDKKLIMGQGFISPGNNTNKITVSILGNSDLNNVTIKEYI